MGGPGTAAPPQPQWGMATVGDIAGTPIRHTDGTDGARPEQGALACHKYRLMVLKGTTVYTADAGDQGSEDGHEATRGTSD